MSRESLPKAARVVRYRLKDGTLKVKRYPAYAPTSNSNTIPDTLGALIETWERSPRWRKLAPRTKAQYVTYLRHLRPMAGVLVREVSRRDLLEIIDALANTKGDGSAIGFARVASALFGFALDREWIDHTPAQRLQKELEHGHLEAWSQEEADLALATLPEHLRRPVVLALYTGQRRGDLTRMTWAAYDGRKIRLVQQKTGMALAIAAPDELKIELDAWRGGSVAPLPGRTILTNKFGRPWQDSNLSKQVGDALAKIPAFPPHRNIHGLRKLAAANLAQAGCSVHEIAAITGHKSLSMLQLYTASINQERAADSAIIKLDEARRKRILQTR